MLLLTGGEGVCYFFLLLDLYVSSFWCINTSFCPCMGVSSWYDLTYTWKQVHTHMPAHRQRQESVHMYAIICCQVSNFTKKLKRTPTSLAVLRGEMNRDKMSLKRSSFRLSWNKMFCAGSSQNWDNKALNEHYLEWCPWPCRYLMSGSPSSSLSCWADFLRPPP